jgi:hypothetical protein
MLNRAQAFSDTIIADDLDSMEAVLRKSNAFEEGDEGVLKIIQ